MADRSNTAATRSSTRRAFLKSGVLSAVATVATASGSANATGRSNRAAADADRVRERTTATLGALLPYQFRPDRAFTVVEADLERQPQHLEGTVRTHVVAYDHAPSLRAFVFTAANETLDRGRSFAFERTRRLPAIGADRAVVGVDLDPVG